MTKFKPLVSLLILGLFSNCSIEESVESELLWENGDPVGQGWEMCGPGKFIVQDGALVSAGGMGMLWYSAKEYQDFQLELEWMVEDVSHNSGVFVRFPNPADDVWISVNQGYEIQICDTAGPKHDTGSIYSFQAATTIPTLPAGSWNHYSIQVIGHEYRIEINGVLVNEFEGERTLRGFIGLQNHDDASPVHFRNIRVTEIQSRT